MIDKLKLWTDDFRIEKENSLILKRGDLDLKTGEILKEYGLFERSDGRIEIGSKAYLNNKEFKNGILPYNIEINTRGLFLSFNPSLIYYQDHNLYSVTNWQLRDVTERIKYSLKENGIRLDLDSMNLSRIDLKRDIYTDYPYIAYTPIFDWMAGKRLKSVEYEGSYSFRNKSRQVIFYDKLRELEAVHGIKRESLRLGSGLLKMSKENELMRGELRLLRKKVVESNLNIIEAKELYKREAYEHCNKRYSELLKELIFQPTKATPESMIYFKTDLDLLEQCKARTKNWVGRYLKIIGAQEIVERWGSLEAFRELLRKAGCEREYTYRITKRIRRWLTESREANKKGGFESSFGELYNELYTKFLKVA